MGGWTNFPNGITSLGIPTFGTGILPPFPGKYFFVEEFTTAGVSAGSGTAQNPYNTIEQALAQCTAGNNDVIFLTGTLHKTSSIVWSKNNTHLVGLCAPLKRGKRARVSVSGSTAFSYLFDVSASGCIFANFGTFYGFAVTGSTTPICWRDTGGRNSYELVEILGFGDSTVTTGTANQTGARSLLLSGSTGECTFRSCVLGVDTISRGAANYNLEIAGGSPRNWFIDTAFEAMSAAGGAGGGWLLIGSAGIDRYLQFDGCQFMNAIGSTATAFTQGLNVSGSAGGIVMCDERTSFLGCTNIETSASARVYTAHSLVVAADAGLALATAP